MSAQAARTFPQDPDPSTPTESRATTDTGLTCLLILARLYDLPADGSQLRHQFSQSGQALSDTDLLRAAKHLGLKAGLIKTRWSKLQGTPLPAMAKLVDGGYLVLAKVGADKVLIQNPAEARPLVISREQFEVIWTGELLLFSRNAPRSVCRTSRSISPGSFRRSSSTERCSAKCWPRRSFFNSLLC